MISLMAESGWDLQVRSNPPYNETLLHHAARNGNAEVCQELINLGFDPNDQSSYAEQSPLLLSAGLSINTSEGNCKKSDAFRTAKVLIINGADPNLSTTKGMTPLIYICNGMTNGRPDIAFIEYLLASGADTNLTQDNGQSPLSIAVAITWGATREDRLKVIDRLLKKGADPNQFCHARFYSLPELKNHNYKVPPIVGAICQNDSTLVEMLIEFGADIVNPVRATKYGSWYPLDYAVKFNKKEIAEILIKHGAKN